MFRLRMNITSALVSDRLVMLTGDLRVCSFTEAARVGLKWLLKVVSVVVMRGV